MENKKFVLEPKKINTKSIVFFSKRVSTTILKVAALLLMSCTFSSCSQINGLEYELIKLNGSTSATIVDCVNSVTKANIPATIKGYPVTSIGDNAFKECKNLTSVTLPNSIAFIGHNAFQDCSKLTNIIIPDSVTSIGNFAFQSCSNLINVSLPNSVTSIGESAFESCWNLASIIVPNSVTAIGSYSFKGCAILTIYCQVSSKPIGWSDNWAGDYDKPVLWGCLGNGKVNGVEYVIVNSVSAIIVSGDNLNTTSIPSTVDGHPVTSIGNFAFSNCNNLTNITVPNGVASIGDYAFEECKNLTSVVIPNSVTSVGSFAFHNCENLADATISNSLTSINIGVFAGCYNLKSIVIPNSVTSIGDSAFANCTGLKSIVIPNSVTTINKWAFVGCWKLTVFCQAQSKPEGWSDNLEKDYNIQVLWGCLGNGKVNGVEYVIVNSVSAIIVSGDNINTISIPSIVEGYPVTAIGDRAFSSYSNLISVTIPNSVTSIGESAFSDCSNLTIYCQATSKPNGWLDAWNADNNPVVWGYNG